MKLGKKRKWTIGCLGGVAALLVLGVGIGVYVLKPFGGPGPFQQSDLEPVIALIREEKLEPGRVHRFRLDDELSPKSLRRLKGDERIMRGQGRGLVWAEVKPEGELRVAIETVDRGHAGEWGFLYSDGPVTTADIDELGREWHLESEITTNWWIIHYDLG
jgi:hypothetical protein